MLLFGLMLMASFVRAQSQTVFVNEIIRDGQRLVGSTFVFDVEELVEIAGPANTNVNSWSLVFYGRIPNVNGNINQGAVTGSAVLSGTIPDQENGYGTLAFTFPPGTISAGTERKQGGIAVVNASGEVTNFISYFGSSLTAVSGPAAGLVAPTTTTPGPPNGTNSIQLQGTGSIYTDFTWSGLFEKTPGQVNKAFINNKQIFVQPTFVNISVNPTTLTESRTSGTTSFSAVVTVTATRPVVGNQSVRVRASGTNISGDVGFSLTTIPIASGATSGTALMSVFNDDDIEGTETAILTIDNPSESVFIGPTNTATVTILDDDAPPALTVSPTTLNFSTSQGTASPEQSYVLSATALTGVLEARAPSGYQISKTSTTGFANVVTFPNSTTSATVYVRLAANAPVGAVDGTIINFSGSQTANVGVTGTVSSTVPANQAPVAVSNPNQTATVGVNFTYVVNAFTDPNGDVLTYSASGLPAGLTFDAGTRTISGVASASGVSMVTITATDPGSLSASTTFTITVNPAPVTPPANQAPVAVSNSNQTATVGQNFSYVVNAFTDPNGDVLTYSASGLPAGLSFDANSRTISGVASASGVSTVTITATDPGNLSASTSFTITVNPAPVTPPTNQAPVAVSNDNQTATVGVNFSYTVNAFTDPNGDVLTYSASGLPSGLTFDANSRTISGVASASGVSTVTITVTDPGSLSASTTFTIMANPAPVTPPANQAPVAVSNPNQTATVGQNFSYVVNAFTDPNGDVLTYSASGLPAGLTFDAGTRTISGVASASGVSTVTITATDPGNLSANTTFIITVNPAPVTPPANQAPVAVSNNNQTATVGQSFNYTVNAFTDPNGDVLTYTASGLPAGLNFDAGTRTISGVASASGVSTVTITATDPGNLSASTTFTITVNPAEVINPPTPGSFAITGVTTVNCATVTAGLRTLTFAPQYTGTNGQPVTFEVVNETLPTTAPGPYRLNLYTDNPTVTLRATQSGTAGESSFSYSWLAACVGGSTPPPTPTPGSFAITGVTTVNCAVVTASQRTLTFTPEYSGTNGQPITFEVLNESLPTTASGPYTLTLYTDNPTVTLKATQSGTAGGASFSYNWLAACGSNSARKGAESGTALQVRVLGNPVQNVVEVEVTGAQGTALTLSLTDMQNRVVGQSRSEQAGAAERHRFNVSAHPDGVLLLRVSTNSQTKTVRIVKVK
ncbi:hypothetical protein GCM10027423_55850 [Spirosoma arcticum]